MECQDIKDLKPWELDGCTRGNVSGDWIFPEQYLHLVPWDRIRLKEDEMWDDWSLSRGGRGLGDDQWSINFFPDPPKMHQYSFVLPRAFTLIFKHFEKWGDEQRVRQIRNAIRL